MSTNLIILSLDSFSKARQLVGGKDDSLSVTANTLVTEIKKRGMTPDLLDLTLAFLMQRLAAVKD